MAMLQVSISYVIDKLTKNSLTGLSEFKITNELSTNDILKLTELLKKGANKTLLLEYSANPFAAKSSAGKQAAALLNNYLFINQLNRNDVSVLKHYDTQNTLNDKNRFNTSLTDYSGKNFDNALHYYLASLQTQTTPITNAQYDVINHLLDNKTLLSKKSRDILEQLQKNNVISVSRLRLIENGHYHFYFPIKREWVKILGNSFGLSGEIAISSQLDANKPSPYINTVEFEGASAYFAATNLLGALEAFAASDTFKAKFSLYQKHIATVIKIIQDSLSLQRKYENNPQGKISAIMSKLSQDEIVYLLAGSALHTTAIVLSPKTHHLISCNKGEGIEGNKVATFYELPPLNKVPSLLPALIDKINDSMDEYLDCLNALIEIESIEGTPQKTGSCSFSGNKAGFHAFFLLLIGKQTIADEISKTFAAFHRTFMLQQFIESPIAQQDIPFFLKVLHHIFIAQHDLSKPDEAFRINLMINELKKEKYSLYRDDFLSQLRTVIRKGYQTKNNTETTDQTVTKPLSEKIEKASPSLLFSNKKPNPSEEKRQNRRQPL